MLIGNFIVLLLYVLAPGRNSNRSMDDTHVDFEHRSSNPFTQLRFTLYINVIYYEHTMRMYT